MIISASRRTDIPAFYMDWFFQRLREGMVCVRNPFSYHQVSRIALNPDAVDAIVFWSKNPAPLLARLEELEGYMYYIQFTLNAYGRDVEKNLPPLAQRVDTFRMLASRLGKERVIWRYDPMGITPKYPAAWHLEQFAQLAEALNGFTETCVISFLDRYPSVEKNMKRLSMCPPDEKETVQLAGGIAAAARENGMRPTACCESAALASLGIGRAQCVDGDLLSRLLGCCLEGKKDRNQRNGCGCMESVDIGAYNTCRHGCAYCYAGGHSGPRREKTAGEGEGGWQQTSPLLGSYPQQEDRITEKKGRLRK